MHNGTDDAIILPGMKLRPRHIVFGISVALVMVLLSISLFHSPSGLNKYHKMKAERDRVVAANKALIQKNDELSAEVKALQDDSDYIEKIARDQIGLIKGNEVIFKLRK